MLRPSVARIASCVQKSRKSPRISTIPVAAALMMMIATDMQPLKAENSCPIWHWGHPAACSSTQTYITGGPGSDMEKIREYARQWTNDQTTQGRGTDTGELNDLCWFIFRLWAPHFAMTDMHTRGAKFKLTT